MKRQLESVFAIVTLGLLLHFGFTQVTRLTVVILSFPYRFMAGEDLKVLAREVQTLPDEPNAQLDPGEWVSRVLKNGREDAVDPWGTPYGFFDADGKRRAHVPGPYRPFVVASAGADRAFGTPDDVLQGGGEIERLPRRLASALPMDALAPSSRTRTTAPSPAEEATPAAGSSEARPPATATAPSPSSPGEAGIDGFMERAAAVWSDFRDREPSPERQRYDPLARIRHLMP